MRTISANEIKTDGVGAIASALEQEREVVVSVGGELRYVVMPVEEYQRPQQIKEKKLNDQRSIDGRFHNHERFVEEVMTIEPASFLKLVAVPHRKP